jgi:hypothetical protein
MNAEENLSFILHRMKIIQFIRIKINTWFMIGKSSTIHLQLIYIRLTKHGYVITASLLGKPIFMLGDANGNMLRPDGSDSYMLVNFCRCFNLPQMIKSPTRITQNTESLTDVVLASNPEKVLETNVVHSSISDHQLVYAVLQFKKKSALSLCKCGMNGKIARKTKDQCIHLVSFQELQTRSVKRQLRFFGREYVREQTQNNKNNTNCIWKSIPSCIPMNPQLGNCTVKTQNCR